MAKVNTITVKCKYCGRDFPIDSRHPHACCCRSPECRRAAAREHSRHYYNGLIERYASRTERNDPYHRMLDRKKSERQKRLTPPAVPESGTSTPPRTLIPRIRPVSSELLCLVLEMIFSFISGITDPDENRRCILHNLERMLILYDAPAALTEIRNFIELFHARFPHLRQNVQEGAPNFCSTKAQ